MTRGGSLCELSMIQFWCVQHLFCGVSSPLSGPKNIENPYYHVMSDTHPHVGASCRCSALNTIMRAALEDGLVAQAPTPSPSLPTRLSPVTAQPPLQVRPRDRTVTVLHYNMQYYFLEPSDEIIVDAYVETYSPQGDGVRRRDGRRRHRHRQRGG